MLLLKFHLFREDMLHHIHAGMKKRSMSEETPHFERDFQNVGLLFCTIASYFTGCKDVISRLVTLDYQNSKIK